MLEQGGAPEQGHVGADGAGGHARVGTCRGTVVTAHDGQGETLEQGRRP